MDTNIHQPHDSLFKKSMSDIRIAKDFFQSHLPISILKTVDLKQLQLENHSFIDERYSKSESDIVYSVKNKGGGATYFYLLCEQQSKVHEGMPFRLLKYKIRLMDQHLKQNPKDNLPIVYPMVLYSGGQRWNKSKSLFPYFGKQATLAKILWNEPFQLIDLHRMDDETIQKRTLSGLMEFSLKNKVIRNSREFLEKLFPWLEAVEIAVGDEFAKITLQYVLHEADAKDKEIFIEELEKYQSLNKRGDGIMSIAEYLREKGREKGREEGREQGRKEGREQGLQNGLVTIAKKMLTKGMALELIVELTGLDIATVNNLQSEVI